MAEWSQSAAERLTRGEVRGVYQATGWIMDAEGMVQRVLTTAADASDSGDNPIVAAPGAGKIIRVLAADIHAAGVAVGCRFRSGTTAISGLFSLLANAGRSLPYNPHGWFQTAPNTALNLNLSTGLSSVGVVVVYVVVNA